MCSFLFLATCDRTLFERLRKVLTDIDHWRLRGKSDGTIARRQFVTTSWNRNANISSADSKISAIYLIRTSRSLFPEVAQLRARLQSARYNLYPFRLNRLVWINRNSKIVQNVYPCFDHFLVISVVFSVIGRKIVCDEKNSRTIQYLLVRFNVWNFLWVLSNCIIVRWFEEYDVIVHTR